MNNSQRSVYVMNRVSSLLFHLTLSSAPRDLLDPPPCAASHVDCRRGPIDKPLCPLLRVLPHHFLHVRNQVLEVLCQHVCQQMEELEVE